MEDLFGQFGVVTYLSLIKKYPEARDDLLELRRQKNRGLKYIIAGVAIFAFLFGYAIAGLIMVF